MNTFYVVATDRMSWGRGTREWEAVAHALAHGGPQTKRVILFQVNSPEGAVESDIHVNEMGSIVAPSGSEVKELGTIQVNNLAETFFNYIYELDNILDDGLAG